MDLLAMSHKFWKTCTAFVLDSSHSHRFSLDTLCSLDTPADNKQFTWITLNQGNLFANSLSLFAFLLAPSDDQFRDTLPYIILVPTRVSYNLRLYSQYTGGT